MEIKLGTVGKLIISKELEHIIDSLHQLIGKSEWSGPLFYKLESGNLSELHDLVFKASYMYPMDIGSSAETSFDWSGELIDAYSVEPTAMEMSIGHIHSHHSMGAFYSGTDDAEVRKNTPNFNYYLTLIVDFTKTYKAKLSINSKVNNFTYKGENGEELTFGNAKIEDVLLLGDLDVEIEGRTIIPDWISNRVKVLNEKKTSLMIKSQVPTRSFDNYKPTMGFVNGYDEQLPFEGYTSHKKDFDAMAEEYLKELLDVDEMDTRRNKTLWTLLYEFATQANKKFIKENLELIDNNVEFIYEELFQKVDRNGMYLDDVLEAAIKKLKSFPTLKNRGPVKDLIMILESYTKIPTKSWQ